MARPRRRRHHRAASHSPLPPPQVLRIERLSHDGRGIAHWQQRPVFVAGALPGEEVRARFTRQSSRFAEAETDAVIRASDSRVEPRCRHFGSCGGCQLQYMPAGHQVQAKEAAVLDQLSRLAGVVPGRVMPAVTDSSWGYRQQARLGIRVSVSGEVTLGFRRSHSRELLNLEECPILAPALALLLDPLRQLLAKRAPPSLTHIALAQVGGDCALTLRHTRPLPAGLVAALEQLRASRGCHIWLQGSADPYQLTSLDGEAADPRLHYSLSGLDCRFAVHPADFMQVNRVINERMVAQAVDWLAPRADEHLLDLFCGLGNFTLPLARRAGRVTGVEVTAAMVARGRENAALNRLEQVMFTAADLGLASAGTLLEQAGEVDALLLDPPRAGAREVCEQMALLNPRRLLYVSCNPATLARDAGILQARGYHLQQLGILDMFPHTSHVESMALFVRQ